jgi:hypothetical protein
MKLEISATEKEFLRTVLDRFVAETKGEIYRTETAAYKDGLKQQEAVAQTLLAKLQARKAA